VAERDLQRLLVRLRGLTALIDRAADRLAEYEPEYATQLRNVASLWRSAPAGARCWLRS
jgi:hypothetical protein